MSFFFRLHRASKKIYLRLTPGNQDIENLRAAATHQESWQTANLVVDSASLSQMHLLEEILNERSDMRR